jgi:hypothetical protein
MKNRGEKLDGGTALRPLPAGLKKRARQANDKKCQYRYT